MTMKSATCEPFSTEIDLKFKQIKDEGTNPLWPDHTGVTTWENSQGYQVLEKRKGGILAARDYHVHAPDGELIGFVFHKDAMQGSLKKQVIQIIKDHVSP